VCWHHWWAWLADGEVVTWKVADSGCFEFVLHSGTGGVAPYLRRVVLHPCIWLTIVRRIRVRIVAEHGQHGRYVGHVAHHIAGYLADPLGHRLQIYGLDDLVRRPFHPANWFKLKLWTLILAINLDSLGQGHAVRLIDELLVVQHRIVPWNVQEFQYLSHPFLGMQDELFIVDLV